MGWTQQFLCPSASENAVSASAAYGKVGCRKLNEEGLLRGVINPSHTLNLLIKLN